MNTPARRTLGAIAAGLLLAAGPAALAAPITVSQTYQFLDNVSPNALGIGAGTRQQFGSTCVVLTGNACSPQNLANAQGTTVSATQGTITSAESQVMRRGSGVGRPASPLPVTVV